MPETNRKKKPGPKYHVVPHIFYQCMKHNPNNKIQIVNYVIFPKISSEYLFSFINTVHTMLSITYSLNYILFLDVNIMQFGELY